MELHRTTERWREAPLGSIVQMLCRDHHRWLNHEFPALERMIDRAARSPECEAFASIEAVAIAFTRLREEMETHMRSEETLVFPAILAVERAVQSRTPIRRPKFGSLRNPITMLGNYHATEPELAAGPRNAGGGLHLPPEAPEVLHELFEGLRMLELALHHHRHIEEAVLFPRALEIELLPGTYHVGEA